MRMDSPGSSLPKKPCVSATCDEGGSSAVPTDGGCEGNGTPIANVVPSSNETDDKRLSRSRKFRSRAAKQENTLDCDGDAEKNCQGPPSLRDEKMNGLKTALVHVVKKITKNAHAHFILGLMHQRLCQLDKSVSAYEKAEAILLASEEDMDRSDLLSLVQIHHAQCLLLGSFGDHDSGEELTEGEVEEILSKLNDSMQFDARQVVIWNTLALLLLRTGRPKSAVTILSALISFAPENLDVLCNLGVAHFHQDIELSVKYLQALVLKDKNHPGALVNYAAFLLCKHGSVVAGPGAKLSVSASPCSTAAEVAKQCLLHALNAEPQAAHIWTNLANAYDLIGDHTRSNKCLERAAVAEPNCMGVRYAVARSRVKEAERYQDPVGQMDTAADEMASVLRDGDPGCIDAAVAWSGFGMVHAARHEIAATFGAAGLPEMEDRTLASLNRTAVLEGGAVRRHRLGLHALRTQNLAAAQSHLKAAAAAASGFSPFPWLNLGVALQLGDDLAPAAEAYRLAATATTIGAHSLLSNLGALYRRLGWYDQARSALRSALEAVPGYPPALNNLGLVSAAQHDWDEAASCFSLALRSDPLHDAAKSNLVKALVMSHVPPH